VEGHAARDLAEDAAGLCAIGGSMSRLKLPPVDCRYGAPMGRQSHPPDDPKAPLKFSLRRVVMVDQDCYDNGGAYWGQGAPLYYAEAEQPNGDRCWQFLRARSRTNAKDTIRLWYPNARFYR
jgi:hypothetical protein